MNIFLSVSYRRTENKNIVSAQLQTSMFSVISKNFIFVWTIFVWTIQYGQKFSSKSIVKCKKKEIKIVTISRSSKTFVITIKKIKMRNFQNCWSGAGQNYGNSYYVAMEHSVQHVRPLYAQRNEI